MSNLERLTVALADRYRVDRELGAGGMATVYLAHDLKHERDVAIKVLRPELAAVIGAERFLAEIKTTANLQHPHILSLHDSGEVSGTVYYVMPFVRGESLRDRLSREKQLPIDDAVRIATEVADALGAAHARGIIHRDIKPENILLQDGHALVADFGIALAAATNGGARMTETGMSLGTPTYMSPEQAMGERTVDARTDIYALGAVMYEMLVGDPPFTGSTAQAIVAKVLTSDPAPLQGIRRTIPHGVAEAVQAALQKLPADRPATAALFASMLRSPASGRPTGTSAGRGGAPPSRVMVPALAAAALLATAVAAWGWLRPREQSPVLQYQLSTDNGRPLAITTGGSILALSADDSRLAVVLRDSAGNAVWTRRRDEPELAPVPGATQVTEVALSPDGRVVAAVGSASASDQLVLRSFPLDGSSPKVLADTGVGNDGLWWGRDGWIYLDGLTGRGTKGLERIRQDGLQRERLTDVDTARGELDHVHPMLLPGNNDLLFTVRTREGPFVSVFDQKRRTTTRVIAGANARYVAPGWIVYTASRRTLMAVRFDAASRSIKGQPFALTDIAPTLQDAGDVAVSERGTLLYTTGRLTLPGGRPSWVDLEGRASLLDTAIAEQVIATHLSPDARRIVYGVFQPQDQSTNLFVKSLPSGVPTPLARPRGLSGFPTWSRDGRTIYFMNDSSGVGNRLAIWQVDAGGGAAPRPLPGASNLGPVTAWGDRLLSFTATGGNTATEAHLVATSGAGDTLFVPLFDNQRKDESPAISPDGRWLAYNTVEGVERVLYLRRVADLKANRWLLSRGAVLSAPVWAPDSRTIYVVNARRQMEALSLSLDGGEVQVASRRELFDANGYVLWSFAGFDLSPDGKRFLMIALPAQRDLVRLFSVEQLPRLLERKSTGATK